MRSTRTRPTSRSVSFYAVLVFGVGPYYAAAPFAWAFTLYALWTGAVWSYTTPRKAVFLWSLLEVIFSVYHYALARRVTTTAPIPPTDIHLLHGAFSRVMKVGFPSHDKEHDAKELSSLSPLDSPCKTITKLDYNDPLAQEFREYMRTWFHRKPWSQIHTHEMRQWLYWSIFNAHLPPDHKLSSTDRAYLEEGMAMIEHRAGISIKKGSNPECRPILLTLDPVTIHPRPLSYYAMVCGTNHWLKWWFQREWGLHYGKCGDFEFVFLFDKFFIFADNS